MAEKYVYDDQPQASEDANDASVKPNSKNDDDSNLVASAAN